MGPKRVADCRENRLVVVPTTGFGAQAMSGRRSITMLLVTIHTMNPMNASDASAPPVDRFTVSTTEIVAIVATAALSHPYHLVLLRKETTATLPIVTAIQAPRVAPAIWLPALITWRRAGSSPVSPCRTARA